MTYQEIPNSIQQLMDKVSELTIGEPKWGRIFNNCFANTLLTTIKRHEDGSTFVLTGDIPAMWLRDSTAQVRPYLISAVDDLDLQEMIAGLVKKQFSYILVDPYANAFNEFANGHGHQDDLTEMSEWVWERKYEIDSLCYPIQLAYLLWKNTGYTIHFNQEFNQGVISIINLWETEQNHQQSPYQFERETSRSADTLCNDGKGSPVAVTGMTWSGFRPSDDRCVYHYLVPANMFAVVVLDYLIEIYQEVIPQPDLVTRIKALKNEIQMGIEKFAIVNNQNNESIYAYEVDGLGNYSIMDDANVPSLLAAPYLGYCEKDDPLYLATRKTLLSSENPYYFSGNYAKGIGSEHTPADYIWPIALSIQGMTSTDRLEKKQILDLLCEIDGGTDLMHEGVNVNNPNEYTREWFSWSNMMFCELLLDYYDLRIKS